MTIDKTSGQALDDVIYLASCAIREIEPDPLRIKRMNLDLVFIAAQQQLLAGCCAFALESVGLCTDDFARAKNKAIRKVVLLDLQREEIMERLEDEGIWHMPLKGAVIKEYDPSVGMREMSDNDILFDKARTDDMRTIMSELGFEGRELGKGAHDCFYKAPVYNFEMHRALFTGKVSEQLNPYYEDVISNRLRLDEGKSFEYHFSPEDFYLYIIAHEYKHYCHSGTGLRGCFDTYICLTKLTLDMNYINSEAEKMGISDFERVNRDLSMHLVNGEEIGNSERKVLAYMRASGIYGNTTARVKHKVVEGGGGLRGKATYVISRIIPPMAQLKDDYPMLYKHRILLPVALLSRFIKAITTSRKKVLTEIKTLYKN